MSIPRYINDLFEVQPGSQRLVIKVVFLPSNKKSSFKLEQAFEITPSGLLGGKRKARDNKVIFGRQAHGNDVDVSFMSEDLEVSKQQFVIHCSEYSGFFIEDQGSQIGTKI